MADVLIRSIEMPDKRTIELMHTELACVSRECDRHCENCDLVQDKDELIVAFQEAIRVLETVANAVPLPKGHGKLGDLDALMFDFVKARWEFFSDGDTFLRLLKNAPTIVPAEGENIDGS